MTYQIMYVEDQPFWYETLKGELDRVIKDMVKNKPDELDKYDYEITNADCGETAINFFNEKIFDLLIIDLHLSMKKPGPGVDAVEGEGFKIVSKIKKSKSYKTDPPKILYFSGDDPSRLQAEGVIKAEMIEQGDIFDKDDKGMKLIVHQIQQYITDPQYFEDEKFRRKYKHFINVLEKNEKKDIATKLIRAGNLFEGDLELTEGNYFQLLADLIEDLIEMIFKNYLPVTDNDIEKSKDKNAKYYNKRTKIRDLSLEDYIYINANRSKLNHDNYLSYIYHSKEFLTDSEYFLFNNASMTLRKLKHSNNPIHKQSESYIKNIASSYYYSILALLDKLVLFDENNFSN